MVLVLDSFLAFRSHLGHWALAVFGSLFWGRRITFASTPGSVTLGDGLSPEIETRVPVEMQNQSPCLVLPRYSPG